MADTWTDANPYWQVMTPYQRAAAMSLMETGDPADATNVLGAMVNRARADKADLGVQVGTKIYQPSIEPSQEARLDKIVRSQNFYNLSHKAEDYWTGKEEVPHKATHFLAPEATMLALERGDPQKYKSWRNWTGFDPQTGEYSNVQFRDKSHVFINPGEQKPLQYEPVEHDPFKQQPGDIVAPGRPKVVIGPQPTDPMTGFNPVQPVGTATRPNYMIEPGLAEQQMGTGLPEGAAVNEDGKPYWKDSGEEIQVIRRPNMLPIVNTPNGYELATPKILELLGSTMGGVVAPVKGAGTVLGAGPVRVLTEPKSPALYSAAEAAVSAAPMKTAPATEWSGWLQNQPHVKPDELKWSGLDDYLKTRELDGQQISQQDISKHLAENRLKISEIQYTDKVAMEERMAAMRMALEEHGHTPSKFNEQQLRNLIHDANYGGNPRSKFSRVYDSYHDLASDATLNESMYGPHSEYGKSLVSPGGKLDSYRESILHIPDSKSVNISNKQARGKFPYLYESQHWPDIPNPVLHARHDEIFQVDPKGPSIGPNGENGYRTLRILEMQSDRSARMRDLKKYDKGFNEGKTWKEMDKDGGYYGEMTHQNVIDEMAKLDRLPYGSTNAWTELGIKHMIKKAADEGFDRLSWEPGHIQHTRYGGDDILHGTGMGEVRSVRVDRHGDNFGVTYAHPGDEAPHTMALTRNQLHDVFGKEQAEKLIKGTEKTDTNSYGWLDKAEVNWDKVPVGNEHDGLKRLYDEVLPITANKVLKKFGDTQVVKTTHKYGNKDVDLHTIDLTPKLKETATRKGFPLFAHGIPFPLEQVDHDPYKHTPVSGNPFL